jgi:hypothetical protein
MFGVTPIVVAAATTMGDDSTVVVEVELVTCQLMKCKLGGTIFRRSYRGPLSHLLIFSCLIAAPTRALNDRSQSRAKRS